MAVSNYNTDTCKYFDWNLAKELYLVDYDAVSKLWIDDGYAYINFDGSYLGIQCRELNVTEDETLDERYAFTHQVTFSVDGYANKDMFQGRYYVILKNDEGAYWVVNPFFPCKVTYTFEYGENVNHTVFTASTVSNLPIVRLFEFDGDINYECNNYRMSGVKNLLINERVYSKAGDTTIEYTNDGFKVIEPQKGTCTFQEQFDGANYSQTLSFVIPFSKYKSSWHYNLLEFTKNLYSAVIVTNGGDWILSGFDFGLQPSYSIQASDAKSDPNSITITLANIGNYGHTIKFIENGMQVPLTETRWVCTSANDGYECIDENTAKYLLMEEVDALGTPTGRYMALEGYESQFPQLDIVGTFTDIVTFPNPSCNYFACKVESNIPSIITFRGQYEEVVYGFKSNVDWSIESSSQYITVSPSSGEAGTSYQVHITNSYDIQPNEILNATLSATTCGDNVQTYDVIVSKGSECFTNGLTYNISANGQTVKVPFNCCLSSYSASSEHVYAFQYLERRYLSFFVDENRTGSARTFTIDVTFCDGYSGSISVVQAQNYERWVTEGTQCNNGSKCDFQRKYSGITSDNINTPTNETRFANCVDSNDCKPQTVRWVVSEETTCYENTLYRIEDEQVSYNSGQTWVDSGKKRLGEALSVCQDDDENYIEWRDVQGEYLCDGTTKCRKTRKWVSPDGINWLATDIYMLGDMIEADSTECGYETPYNSWAYERWDLADGYVCDDSYKYERLQRWVSDDNVYYVPTDIYKKGGILETYSLECGYDPAQFDYEYYKYEDEGDYICNGVDKYSYLRKYFSNDNVNWIPSNVYHIGDVVEEHSADCGYVPTPNYVEWRVVAGEYICQDTTKYEKLRQYVSEDDDVYVPMDIYKMGDILEDASDDCGASTPTLWEYQWVLTDETQCGYEPTVPYHFAFDSQTGATALTSSLTYDQTSVEATVFSESVGQNVSYQATNLPEWVTRVRIRRSAVTVTLSQNNTESDRIAQIILVQDFSNKKIVINITQTAYSYDNYIFSWENTDRYKYIDVESGISGSSYGVVSTDGEETIGYDYISKPSWVNYIDTGTRLLTIGWLANTTGTERQGVITLKQTDSPKTITLTIMQAG